MNPDEELDTLRRQNNELREAYSVATAALEQACAGANALANEREAIKKLVTDAMSDRVRMLGDLLKVDTGIMQEKDALLRESRCALQMLFATRPYLRVYDYGTHVGSLGNLHAALGTNDGEP